MLKSSLKLSLYLSLIPVCAAAVSGCDAPEKSQGVESELAGVGSILKSAPIPSPKSIDELANLGRLLRGNLSKRSAASGAGAMGKSTLTSVLVQSIVEVKGLPRSQLVSVLKGVLADDSTLCGGAACGRVFGISPTQEESYLDELAAGLSKLDGKLPRQDLEILAGSLRKDEFAFVSHSVQEAVRRELGIYDRQLTRGDLMKVKKIIVKEGKFPPSDLNINDLKMMPLVTLDVRYRTPAFLESVLKHGKSVSSLSIKHIETHHSLEFSRYVELDKIPFLSKATNIKSLTIESLSLDRTANFASLPPNLKHLEIGHMASELNDAKVKMFSQVSSLKSVSLRMEFAKITASDSAAFNSNIRSVKFFEKSDNPAPCGNLSKLAVFRHATFVTLSGCSIDALKPSQPFAWEALYLAKPSKAKDGLGGKVQLGETLKNLKIVKSEDPRAIDLDAVSRGKVEERARISKDLENGRIIDAIIGADPSCAGGKPKGSVMDRVLACMRPK